MMLSTLLKTFLNITLVSFICLISVISRGRKNKCQGCYNDVYLLCILWHVECIILSITGATGGWDWNSEKSCLLRCSCIKCYWTTCRDISTPIAVYISNRSIDFGWSPRTSLNYIVRIFCDRGKKAYMMNLKSIIHLTITKSLPNFHKDPTKIV